MHKYKITVQYIGTDFCGWQRQDNGISIQLLLENAILAFSKEKVVVFGSGRTDAGVHATGQVAHFILEKYHALDVVMRAINHFLRPHPVAVIDVEIAAQDFHARFSAITRHYLYKIINRKSPSVFDQNRCWHIN